MWEDLDGEVSAVSDTVLAGLAERCEAVELHVTLEHQRLDDAEAELHAVNEELDDAADLIERVDARRTQAETIEAGWEAALSELESARRSVCAGSATRTTPTSARTSTSCWSSRTRESRRCAARSRWVACWTQTPSAKSLHSQIDRAREQAGDQVAESVRLRGEIRSGVNAFVKDLKAAERRRANTADAMRSDAVLKARAMARARLREIVAWTSPSGEDEELRTTLRGRLAKVHEATAAREAYTDALT